MRLRSDDKIDRLVYYDCDSDRTWFLTAVDAAAVDLEGKWHANSFPVTGLESVYYEPLALLLNLCLEACVSASRGKDFDYARSGPYSNLQFLVYDKPTGDGIDGSAALKPDLVGFQDGKDIPRNGLKIMEGYSLYWSHTQDPPIAIPVEVKKSWRELVEQAASYARCLFSARPLRRYALVLAYNHKAKQFRFLIFHRGGSTASRPLDLHTADGRKELVRVFLALLTCQNISDAGFPDWCNDNQFKLPVDEKGTRHVLADIDDVLHHVTCCRGRAARVSLVTYPSASDRSAHDTSPHRRKRTLIPNTEVRRSARISGIKEAANGSRFASSRQVPGSSSLGKTKRPTNRSSSRSEQIETISLGDGVESRDGRSAAIVKTSWQQDREVFLEHEILTTCNGLFGTPKHHYSFQPANANGIRTTNHIFLPTPEQAKDEDQLKSIYWDVLKPGSDPSQPDWKSLWIHICSLIGMSLVQAKSPLFLFEAILHAMLGWLSMFQSGFLHRDISIGNLLGLQDLVQMEEFKLDDELVTLMERLNVQEHPQLNFAEQITRIRKLLGELRIGDKCSGFVIDGDHAVRWQESFNSHHDGTRSGTVEFMSVELLRSIGRGPYLHSPVDDMYSFYYVAQWAAAFNKAGDDYDEIEEIRDGLRRDVANRELVSTRIWKLGASDAEQVGPFLARCGPLLDGWSGRLRVLSRDFTSARRLIETKELSLKFALFRTFAYRGVADFLEVFQAFRADFSYLPAD
ncbi:hypothetical protein GGX14DRAFT_346042 [Mycena pura]|uniref:Fungal-type protein kinase domain-containing protein n=1 Tax=Mycena pura TaxID=153505 RepID=A0AAD6YUH4_9AGAR|nr:hypothetical protein GGX14DRAFT_346042 [Mycena pura]